MKYSRDDVKKAMCLYAVTDSRWLNGRKLDEVVREAVEGGATFIQIREKELPFEAFLEVAKEVKKVTDAYGIPFVVNDEVDIAKKIDADGVHIGQGDEALTAARSRLGKDKIIGVSVQTVPQAIDAEKNGADYLGVGSVFVTSTKTDADFVSLDTVKAICSSVTIPVVAIGGIKEDNILKLKDSGVDGVAIISELFGAKDIKAQAEKLLAVSKKLTED